MKNNISEQLRTLTVDIATLTLDPRNARKHDTSNLAAIRASLERFGQVEPIVVQRQGMVVRAGNGRVAVARELGWDKIAAVIVDQSDAEAAAFAIADNRTGELGTWDYKVLLDVLADIDISSADLGFSDGELSALQMEVMSLDADMVSPTSARERSSSAPDKVRSSEDDLATIRRVMLYMSQAEYDEIMEHFEIAAVDVGSDNHTRIVLEAMRRIYGTAK